MPAYNFQERWARKIEDGEKPHTIRKRRKRPTVIGDKLFLYTGMRTKECRLLKETVCAQIMPIDIFADTVSVNGEVLNKRDLDLLAYSDGFDSVGEFFEFFGKTYGLPCVGQLEIVFWKP